jgi:hypothetical protein
MKAAILCNGPSRILYDPNKDYDYRIGCNVPWTKVDSTVIVDEQVAKILAKDHSLIICPMWFSEEAWRSAAEFNLRPYVEFLGFVKRGEGLSSGNVACKKVLELGYTEIDIYGADAYWQLEHHDGIKSYTRKFLSDPVSNNSASWRHHWNEMIKNNKQVKFSFIKE